MEGRRVGISLLLLCLLYCCSFVQADSVHRQKRQSQFNCKDDQTKVITPYLYTDTATKDCPSLLSEMVDYYDMTYRETCQFWKGGDLPDYIEDSYISFCVALSNGTTKYRAEICCPGATTDLRCFSCVNVASTYDSYLSYNTLTCSHYGTGVQTCADGQVCMTDVQYPITGYGVHTKRCEARSVCEAKHDPSRCQSRVADPACTYCCDTPYCNYEVTRRYLIRGVSTVCYPNPCAFGGTCVVNATADLGYICHCRPGFSGPRCHTHGCSSGPCQNNGVCFVEYSSPYYHCGCHAPHRGDNCEINANLCAINVCQNGGTCYDHLTLGSRCVCTSDYVGSNCSIKVPQSCPVKENVITMYSSYSRSSHSCTDRLNYVQTRYTNTFSYQCRTYMPRLYGRTVAFQEGVHGNVPYTHGASLSACEKGDTTLFFTYTACCPACHSNPCQNGGWCQQTAQGSYTCKCRYGYAGNHCQFKEAICYASGDPHYRTWDSQSLHFQSPCKYIMAQSNNDSSLLDQFQVLVKHEHRNGSTAVSYVKYVEVVFGSQTVKIDKDKVVTVNGVTSAAGATYSGFHLLDNGRFLRLETSFGLIVESDGLWLVVVKVPDEYNGLLEGICGNFDGDMNNDFITRGGIDVQSYENAYTLFGNSWKVSDADEPTCDNSVGGPKECSDVLLVVVKSASKCGFILDESLDNPLHQCVKDPAATANKFFDFCVYDACAEQDGDIDDVICKSIEVFAAGCKDLGYVSDWRAKAGCALDCPANSVYMAKTTACQASCANLNAASECPLPDTENCVCNEGYVREKNACIPPDECGCLDANSIRRTIGSVWLSNDCATEYSCYACADCTPSYQINSTSSGGCADTEKCQLEDGAYQCVSGGCEVDGKIFPVGSEWQTSCTVHVKCTANGAVTSQLPGCKANEDCAVVGAYKFACKPDSCIDPDTNIHHKIGDSWLSSTCGSEKMCQTDGSITSKAHSCPALHECKQQGQLYVCVKKTCKDTKGGIRQIGSRWLSADCSYVLDCLATGVKQTRHACKFYEECVAGDLGKCVALPSAWTPWTAWGACSDRCGSGSQIRYRQCFPPEAVCPGPSTETRACVCDQDFNIEDCENSELGYLPDVCNCQGYIQCVKTTDTTWTAIHRTCPACTEWNQDIATCQHVQYDCDQQGGGGGNTIDVYTDYCIHSSNTKFSPHASDDTKYMWEVTQGTWVAMPCAPGTYFALTSCGCIKDTGSPTSGLALQPITCLSFDITFVGSRNVWAAAHEAVRRTGRMGQAAYFEDNAWVEIPYFNNRIDFPQFSVSLWFKRTGYGSNVEGILSNGRCSPSASVEIKSTSDGTVSASIDTQQGRATITDLKAVSGQWHHIVLVYNGKRLTVYLNNQLFSTAQAVGGLLSQRHCNMFIGTAGTGLDFTGLVDQVCFYSDALAASDVLKLYQEGTP